MLYTTILRSFVVALVMVVAFLVSAFANYVTSNSSNEFFLVKLKKPKQKGENSRNKKNDEDYDDVIDSFDYSYLQSNDSQLVTSNPILDEA